MLVIRRIFSACLGLRGCLLSSNLINGGVTGISMLLAKTTGLPLAVLLPLVNLPFIAVGYRQMGRVRDSEHARDCGTGLSSRVHSVSGCHARFGPDCGVRWLFIGAGIAHTIQTLRDLRLNREANCLSKCGQVCLSCRTAMERAVRRYEPSPGHREGLALGRIVSSRGHQNS